MSRLPLGQVRVLSISEIAELWAQEAEERPRSLIERELRIFLLNRPRLSQGEGPIQPIPEDDQLPPATGRLSKSDLEEFCAKQGWTKPRFWFGRVTDGPGFPGRPTIMRAIVQELERRAEAGQLSETLTDQATELVAWANERLPPGPIPIPGTRSVANAIRKIYWALRNA